MSNLEDDRARYTEISNQINGLNLEAEKILLKYQSDKSVPDEPAPEGTGKCDNWCLCPKYVSGGASPGICDRPICRHEAYHHAW